MKQNVLLRMSLIILIVAILLGSFVMAYKEGFVSAQMEDAVKEQLKPVKGRKHV